MAKHKKTKTPGRYVRACQLTQVAASIEAARSGVAGAWGLATSKQAGESVINALVDATGLLELARDKVFAGAFESLHGKPPSAAHMPGTAKAATKGRP